VDGCTDEPRAPVRDETPPSSGSTRAAATAAAIDPGWAVIDGAAPNGGYVMALAARAMRDPVPHPDPVTLTAHFLAPPAPGEVTIDVEVLRTGRRHSTVSASMQQDDREVARLLGPSGTSPPRPARPGSIAPSGAARRRTSASRSPTRPTAAPTRASPPRRSPCASTTTCRRPCSGGPRGDRAGTEPSGATCPGGTARRWTRSGCSSSPTATRRRSSSGASAGSAGCRRSS
jgi:hypothetical protein